MFAGRECARALALMSTKVQDCSADVADLAPDKLKTLSDWEDKFQGKYAVVGSLAGSGADAAPFQGQADEIREALEAARPPAPAGAGRAPLLTALAALAVAGVALLVAYSASRNVG